MITSSAFITHLLYGFVLFLISAGICRYISRCAFIMDVPNKRSSHSKPTPKSGGIAIVVTFVIGVAAIAILGKETLVDWPILIGFAVSAVVIAIVSLLDDLGIISSSLKMRLTAQSIAALSIMAFGIVIHEITLPWLGKVPLGLIGLIVTFLWIMGLTNAFNFMDGLNGMAGGTAVIVCVFFSYISYRHGSNFAYLITYSICAGALGFLMFNFPRATLFMGDVGSAFLGFVFATLAIVAALYDHAHTSLFVMPLLLFHFIYETLFTFIRRFVSGDNVFEAHRTHFYQLINQMGLSHTQVSLIYWGICAVQGFGALWMITIPDNPRVLVFLPFLIFQIIYSIVVTRMAKRRGLI
ncbi:MAG: glycosyltransferase family 4 protein [Pseudomonadota bacterium]